MSTLRSQLREVPSRVKFESPAGSFIGFQIYYDEHSRSHLDPNLNAYFNERATKFLESQVIVDLVDSGAHLAADFFGVFSWKMQQKLTASAAEIFRFMESDRFSSDVYTFDFLESGKSVWHYADDFSTLGKAGEYLLHKLGYRVDLAELETLSIYQNHYVCRSSVYESFCREMLKPALALVESGEDAELSRMLDFDTAYPFEDRLKPQIQRVFGRPCYTRHPFIAERLFATWIALKSPERKLKIAILPSTPRLSSGTALPH